MATVKSKVKEPVLRSSGNVFRDLGFGDAEERQTKVRLAMAINQILMRRGRSQSDAAGVSASISPRSLLYGTIGWRAFRWNG